MACQENLGKKPMPIEFPEVSIANVVDEVQQLKEIDTLWVVCSRSIKLTAPLIIRAMSLLPCYLLG